MEENERHRPRWEDEDWTVETPDPEKCKCKKCFLREEDRQIGDRTIHGCTLGTCAAFNVKPNEILFQGEDCPYFIDEDEKDED